MKTRREFLKSMAAVLLACGVLTGCSGSVSVGSAQSGTGKDDSNNSTTNNGSGGTKPQPDNNVPNLDEYRKEVLRLVNEERAKAGVGPLDMDDTMLTNAAQVRAKEITESFSHTRPDGRKCGTAYFDQGGTKTYIGENIAAGYTTPQKVVQGWMESTGHRENILRPQFKKIGVGYYYKTNTEYTHYWVQMFTD